jgi:hypothetical protein
MVTDKKAQANRENSLSSTGPLSPRGKARTRLNAISFGLFSKDSVLAAAGENQEDFDRLRIMVWEQFKPRDAVTALLVEDFVATYWRLQRPRRCENAEVRRRLDTAVARRHYEKITEANSLKISFIRSYTALQSSSIAPTERTELGLVLDQTRRQLQEKSLGVKFLVGLLKPIAANARVRGCLSAPEEAMLVATCGLADEDVKSCMLLNQIATKEVEKIKSDSSADKTTVELNKTILCLRLESKIRTLSGDERVLQKLESIEESAYLFSLVMPPAESSERIHRAEAALERRL